MADFDYAARLELIRKVAKAHKAKMQREKQMLAEIEAGEKVVEDDDTNINQWTDASKYAEEHYGDRLRDQQNYEYYEGWN